MNSLSESLIAFILKGFGFIIARLPVGAALAVGRAIGVIGYYLDVKHKSIAYSNLKIAFAKTKKPSEIKHIVKQQFKNYGQNLMDLFRLPVMHRFGPEKSVTVEGKEHFYEALKKKKGVILLAMHFGSWEITTLLTDILKHPYRMLAKPQKKFSVVDDIINSYRECSGSLVIARGRGTREIIESLKANEIVGMVVDQGGRDGVLVKFFGRLASMSVGAIRIGLKLETPICFCVIIREKNSQHRLIIHPPLELTKTGDAEKDIVSNLDKVIRLMEDYITRHPSEYMWFYKIWKYSKESATIILSDGKAGHLRQSEAVAEMVEQALAERGVKSEIRTVEVNYKNKIAKIFCSLFSFLMHPRLCQGRLRYLKWFLTKKTYLDIASVKADFVVSCGSSIAGVNFLLSRDLRAKNISVLKPGILGFRRFDLVILPRHDRRRHWRGKIAYNVGALNLVSEDYLKEQAKTLVAKFSHLQDMKRVKIGVFIGGDTKNHFLPESQIKAVINQIKDASEQMDADMLITTSRRTPEKTEQLIAKETKNHPRLKLLILANRGNVPEVAGGILGLSDIIIVSGDSISMVSEAVSSGKEVIVFPAKAKGKILFKDKHENFLEDLSKQGHIILASEKSISQFIVSMVKGKIKTKPLDNRAVIAEAVRAVI